MNAEQFYRNRDDDEKLNSIMSKILSKVEDENWAAEYDKWVENEVKPYLNKEGFHEEDGHLNRRKRNKFIKSLEKIILQKIRKVPSTRELNARLREHLWFKGKEIKFDDLREDYSEQDFKLKPEGDLEKIYDILSDAARLLDDAQQQRLTNLKRALSSRAEQRDVEREAISTKGLERLRLEVGIFDLGDLEDRKEVYNYWKRISTEFEEFNKRKKKFVEAALKYKETNEEFDSDDSIEVLKSLELEDYIGQFSPADFKLDIPDNLTKAITVIRRWHLLQGIDFKIKEQRGEYPQDTPAKEGASEREQAATREMDPTAGVKDEKKDLEAFDKDGVDPLLYFQLIEEGIENIKPKISDIQEVRDNIELILGIRSTSVDPETEEEIERAYFSEDKRQEFEEWFEDIIEDVRDIHEAGSTEKFHLPYSNFTIEQNKKGVAIVSKYEKFINEIYEIMEDEKMSFASYSANFSDDLKNTETGLKESKGKDWAGSSSAEENKKLWAAINNIRGRMLQEPFTGTGKNMPNEKFSWEEEDDKGVKRTITANLDELWLELLEAINEYILVPLTSEFMVEKELPKWIQGLPSRRIEIENALNNPLGTFLKNTQRRTDEKGDVKGHAGFGRLDASHINDLIAFIKLMSDATKGFDVVDVYKKARDAVDALDAMWGKQFHDVNVESIGGMVHKYADVAEFDEELPDFMNKPIKDLFENYSFPKVEGPWKLDVRYKRYPILLLRSVLQMQPFKSYPAYFLGDLAPKLKELQQVFDDYAANVRTSEINFKLLNAHDTIRKMNGQKVIWAMLSLNDITHMDNVINKMEREHRVGITATEIDSIVKSISSYNSLAKNHGVNEEVIYTVKAMFR